ncbi:hypothetical protein BDW75DRAFT_231508 [Aspergillus navahoensis]
MAYSYGNLRVNIATIFRTLLFSRQVPKKNHLSVNRLGAPTKMAFLGYHSSIPIKILVMHSNGKAWNLFSGVSLKRPREDSDNPPSKRQHLSQEDNPLLKLSSRNLFSEVSLKRPREDSDNPPSKRQHLESVF